MMRVCVVGEGAADDVARAAQARRSGAETLLLARAGELPSALPEGVTGCALEALARDAGEAPLTTAGLPARAGEVFAALRALAREAPLDELRFPARGALAWHAVHDARTGGLLARARVVLELQPGDGALAEPVVAASLAQLQLRDAIRFCLASADEVQGDELARASLLSRGWQLGSPRPEPASGARPRLAVVMAHCDSVWIGETLSSLREQTLPIDEIVIVDDASSASGLARLRTEAARDERVRVHALPENGGPARARNLGVRLTDAPLVWFVDADNVMLPRMAERLVEALRCAPDAAWAQPGLHIFHEVTGETMFVGTPHPPEFSLVPLLLDNASGDVCAIYRRDAFLAVGGFIEDRRAPEDWMLWERFAAAGMRGVLVPEVLFKYRLRPSAFWVAASPSVSLSFATLGALHTPALLAREPQELALVAAQFIGAKIERAQERAAEAERDAQAREAALHRERAAWAAELETARAESRAAQAEAQRLQAALEEMGRSTAVQLARALKSKSPQLHAALAGALKTTQRWMDATAPRPRKGNGRS